MRVLSSLKTNPRGASHAASRALTCCACSREWHRASRSSAYLTKTGESGLAVPALLPLGMYRTPAACSIPCKATFSSTGLTTPPCGLPRSVGANRPWSITPAFNQAAILPLAGNDPSCPLGFQRTDRQGLQCPVGDHGNPKPTPLSVRLGDKHPLDGLGAPRGRVVLEPVGQLGLLPSSQHDPAVDPGRLATSVSLRHPPNAQQRVRTGAQHQLLQIADLLQVPCLGCREDPLPQPPYVVLDPTPIHRVPVQDVALRSVHHRGVQLAHRLQRLCSPGLHRLT